MTLRVVPLGTEHRRLVDRFETDAPELAVYLRRWALRHQERDRLSRTWIALDGDGATGHIAGWYALSVASVERARLPSEGALAALPGFPVPAVLLARLAVDRRVQGQGLGTWLFDDALRRTLQLAREGPVGVRLFITDAKGERAAGFYERRGMTALAQDGWPRRLVIDLAPLLDRPR